MTKQKLFKHVLPVFLAALLLLSTLPMSVFAQDESTDEAASKIVREVVELREESVKHFLCEDGSYIAVSYAEPVHYEKNGEWLEIDNTLVLSSKKTYVPKSSDVAVSIPQSFSGGKQITATNDGHTISFGVASGNENVALSKTAAVKAVEALPSSIAADVSVETLSNAQLSSTATVGKIDTVTQIEAYNSEKTTVDNQAGALVYDKIFPNADLEYIVTGNSIKENVVVYQPQTEYVYTFDMDFGGLTPVAEEDGSISLVDSTKQNKVVFVISAPYMYDANGEESYAVTMSLAPNGEKYLLTVTADSTWINSSERAFPVVIDPTITLPNDEVDYNFNDVFVIDGVLDDSTKDGIELRAGRNLANLTRTYLKPDIPSLPTGAVIDNAQLILQKKTFFNVTSADSMEIYIFDCYGMPSWSPETITWNNQPYSQINNGYPANEKLSSCIVDSGTQACAFDITSAAERWLSTGTNSGLMLASATESQKMQVDFFSSRAWLFQSKRPQMTFTYSLPGIDTNLLTFDSSSATSSEIEITTSEAWTVTVEQPWISVSKTSGTGSSEFTISVTKNTSASQREGTVMVWMGSVKIGEIKVYQSGTGAFLLLDEDTFFIDYKTCSKTVTVETNASWSVSDDADWLNVEKSNTDADKLIISVAEENTTDSQRTATVTVTAEGDLGNVPKTIEITQYDKVTCLFNTINEDGTLSAISSSEYNHALATWAMELSYAAYNPVTNEAIPGVPSNFMEPPFDDPTLTAEAELLGLGFEATAYNYPDENGSHFAAHTIGHKTTAIMNLTEETDNEYMVINSMVNVSDMDMDTGTHRTHTTSEHDSGNLVLNSSSSSQETENNIVAQQLVVISVRGSVTPWDWVMNLCTQFHIKAFEFEDGCEEVLESLYGYADCTECDGTDNTCPCKGYLMNHSITNPIILITGHSLGAAIANLVAAELNKKEGQADVYAYTFATPTVTSLPTTAYSNIFNVLNANDVVTYLPDSLLLFGISLWSRHGIDIPINMPFTENDPVDKLGVECHSMAVYMRWMNNNPDMTYESIMEESSKAKTRGILPWFFRIKCPVGVTVKDSEGNIIAYESQEDGKPYPEITDTGIVSWIDDDGAKVFFMPQYADAAKIEIDAYDYGTMTMSIGLLGAEETAETDETDATDETTEVLNSITYNNVNLFPGRAFDVDLTEIAEDVSMEDISLMEVEVNADGTRTDIGEITDLNPLLKGVTVQNPEVNYGTHTVIQVVTDKSVSKVQFIHDISGATITCAKDSALVVSVVEDGDNLIWTIQRVFTRGTHVYDVAVKVGYTWYRTENVFEITIN